MLTNNRFSLHMKGRVYDSCVTNVMLNDTEAYPVDRDDIKRLKCAEKRILRCVGDGSTKRLGTSFISEVMTTNTLYWFDHVEKNE